MIFLEFKKKNFFFILSFTLAVLAYLYSFINYDATNLQIDEVHFAHQSLGFPYGQYYNTNIKLFDINLFNWAYAGTLKSFIFSIIFYIFDFSISSVRIPIFILQLFTAITSLFLFRKKENNILGYFLFIFFLANPSINFLSRLDMQFIVFQNLIFLFVIFYLNKILNKEYISRVFFVTLLIFCLLALYSHLKFFFLINSIFITFIILFYLKNIEFNFVKKFLYLYLPCLFLYLLIFCLFLDSNEMQNAINKNFSSISDFKFFFTKIFEALSGNQFFLYYGYEKTLFNLETFFLILTILIISFDKKNILKILNTNKIKFF